MRVLTKKEKDIYISLMKTVEWIKLDVPVKKNPFGGSEK